MRLSYRPATLIFALGLAAETFFAVRAVTYYRRNPHG